MSTASETAFVKRGYPPDPPPPLVLLTKRLKRKKEINTQLTDILAVYGSKIEPHTQREKKNVIDNRSYTRFIPLPPPKPKRPVLFCHEFRKKALYSVSVRCECHILLWVYMWPLLFPSILSSPAWLSSLGFSLYKRLKVRVQARLF